jgi:hypothetical protein
MGDMKVCASGEGEAMELAEQEPAMTICHLLTNTLSIPYQGGPTPAHKMYSGMGATSGR